MSERSLDGESLGLARRELERAENGSPLVRGRIVETIPSLVPDMDGHFLLVPELRQYVPAPECGSEFIARIGEPTFSKTPVPYSRLLIGRMRAVARSRMIPSHVAFLLRLAKLPEEQLTPYQLAPGETAPPPPKSLVRYLAIRYLINVNSNDLDSWEFLLQRARTTADDQERLLLRRVEAALLERLSRDDRKQLILRSWIPDVRRRLQGPPNPVSLEIVFGRLETMSKDRQSSALRGDIRALAEEILQARGRFPLTAAPFDTTADLTMAAREVLERLDAPGVFVGRRDTVSPWYVFDPWKEWLDSEPAHGSVSEAEASARIAELDGELARLRSTDARCHVLIEIGRWANADEANRHFEDWTPSLFDDAGHIRLSRESLCQMHAMFGLEQADTARRIALLVRLLRAKFDEIAQYDRRDDLHNGYYVYLENKEQVREVAARVLAAHVDWIGQDAGLREWLTEQALQNPLSNHYDEEIRMTLQPAFERLLAFYEASSSPDDRERGRAILRGWITGLRSVMQAGKLTSAYPTWTARDRKLALKRFAKNFGIEDPSW